MRFQCTVLLVLAGVAYGQAEPPATPSASGERLAKIASAATDQAHGVKVEPDDPVITLNGFCADFEGQGDSCKTTITRAQFEKFTHALQPGMSLPLRLKVANAYARNLKMSATAEKRGLDKTPEFEEEMRFARMQLLAQDLERALQAEANNITDADIEEYYKKNESSYEQATVARIFIPRMKATVPSQKGEAPIKADADEAAMTKFAEALRARAVNGEDPDRLQIEAYAEAGITRANANTRIVNVRRGTLPPQHETVMELNPGKVSQVFSDPDGAHFIYKMISKKTLPLEDAKAEIRTQISSQRYRDSMKSFEGNVVFNDAYFVPAEKPESGKGLMQKSKQKPNATQ
ncbi:MAG: peptidylprolyl isomerase [Candidatus Sulfotelmatobacter sp.]